MKIAALAAATLCITSATSTAGSYVIPIADTMSRGVYNNTGGHSFNGVYFTGHSSSAVNLQYRCYFIFNLSLIPASEIITGATLDINAGVYSSFDPSEAITFFSLDRTTPSQLRTDVSQPVGISIFEDLGDGTVFNPGYTLSAENNNSQLTISLNDAFLTYARANSSGEVAFGGAVTTLHPSNQGREGVFLTTAETSVPLSATNLIVTTRFVPEPSVWGLVCVASVALLARRKRNLS